VLAVRTRHPIVLVVVLEGQFSAQGGRAGIEVAVNPRPFATVSPSSPTAGKALR
jgi:hypothetical protein